MFSVHRGLHKQVGMMAQLLAEVALLSSECAACPCSLVAASTLCLALACLHCGVWRDGSPGPASSPEQYWTPTMAQATGYEKWELRETLHLLQAVHEESSSDLNASPFPGADPSAQFDPAWAHSHKFGIVRLKYAHPRFLNVLKVPPFVPHSGGPVFPHVDPRSPFVGEGSGLGLAHN